MARDRRWDNIPRLEYRSDEIKAQIDILDAVRMYTGETPNREKKIHCPDPNHTDKNPSCTVDPKKSNTTCKCWSCTGKGTFDVFDLASFAKGLDKFSDIAEEVCKDFGIDPYSVSNKAEREDAIRREFGQEDDRQPEYREYFPLSSKELETIGLHDSDGSQEIFFKVEAADYFVQSLYDKNAAKTYGKPAVELTSDERQAFIDTMPQRVKDKLFDADGNPATLQVSYREVMELARTVNPEYGYAKYNIDGMGGKVDDKGHAFMPTHKISDLWIADKAGTEEMIFNKCGERTEILNDEIAALSESRTSYEKTHDVAREEKLFNLYLETAYSPSNPIQWTETQKKRVQEFCDYRSDANEISYRKEELKKVEGVYDKMNGLLIRRAEYEAQYGELPDKSAQHEDLQ